MTRRVWKDALLPGLWHLSDGRTYRVGPSDIAYHFGRTKAILAEGAPLPWAWEHQASVGMSQDDKRAEKAKHTGGHFHDVRIAKNGNLQALVDASEDDVPQLEKTKFVSPEIRWNVKSPRTGKVWEGPSIVNLAVTPIPVQYPQDAFSFANAKPMSLSQMQHQEPIRLSQATYKGNPMAEKNKKIAEDAAADAATDAAVDSAADADQDADDDAGMNAEDDADAGGTPPVADQPDPDLQEVIGLLHEAGLIVGTDPKSLKDLCRDLKVALQTKKHHLGAGGSSDTNADNGYSNEPEQVEGAPVMMSQTKNGKPVKLSQEQIDGLIAENAALKHARGVEHQTGQEARIAALVKRGITRGGITETMGNNLRMERKTIKLSVNSDGTVAVDAVEARLRAYEEVAKEWDKAHGSKSNFTKDKQNVRLSQGETIVNPPYEPTGDQPDRQVQDEAADELIALCGVRKRS